MTPSSAPSQDDGDITALPEESQVIAQTREWIERAVVGLNLCPFARAPLVRDRLRIRVSSACSTEALAGDLAEELRLLHATGPEAVETSLLVHPGVLGDFLAFNDFLDVADATVARLGLEGEIQVASFHPDYRFADAAPDAIENFTNRSPWPTLHLLRESSIERAVEAMADTDEIYRRNIATLRRLGRDGWQALWGEAGGAFPRD